MSCNICELKALHHCNGCKQVSYCGKKCQEIHWKIGHKNNCQLIKGLTVADLEADWLDEDGKGNEPMLKKYKRKYADNDLINLWFSAAKLELFENIIITEDLTFAEYEQLLELKKKQNSNFIKQLLLKKLIKDPNITDEDGQTALTHAIYYQNMFLINVLLKRDSSHSVADLNLKHKTRGDTPLIYSVIQSNFFMDWAGRAVYGGINTFLEFNKRQKEANDSIEIIWLILTFLPDKEEKNADDQTALEIAIEGFYAPEDVEDDEVYYENEYHVTDRISNHKAAEVLLQFGASYDINNKWR